MMNSLYRTLPIILSLIFHVGVANAKTFKGQAAFSQGLAIKNSEPTSNATFRVDWKLWTLLGEPVDRMVVKWGFSDNIRITIPIDSRSSNVFNSGNSGYISVRECNSYKHISTNSQLADQFCVTRIIMREIRVTELKVENRLGGLGATDCYIFDAGVIDKPGFNNKLGPVSFNTPGSKEWKKSFVSCYKGLSNRYHSVSAAKKFFKSNKSWNSSNTSASISEIKYNFSPVLNFLIMKKKEQERRALKKNHDQKYKVKKRIKKSEFEYDPLADLSEEVYEKDHQSELLSIISSDFAQADKHLSSLTRAGEKDLSITKERVSKRSLPIDKLIVIRDTDSGLYGYGLKNGAMKIPYRFKSARDFSDGLAAIKIENDNNWKFINYRGEIVINTNYDTLEQSFENGRAVFTELLRTEDHGCDGGYVDVNKKYTIDKNNSLVDTDEYTTRRSQICLKSYKY